jgi:hypothetical protein
MDFKLRPRLQKIEQQKEAKLNKEHIELIGFDGFVALWTEHYYKLKDEQKSMMPLKSIAFLTGNEKKTTTYITLLAIIDIVSNLCA